ncbi:MAG: PadR family transcriptional regulator [Gemmatimonadetes bacterium]|nr:PadR family transcriptional regulator [Gemmatimonadota bacterium]
MTKGNYLGEFEQVVLLATARLGENAYGMSIRREIEEKTSRNVSIGAVYATLDRLQGKALLESRMGAVTPQRGGRPKRFFRLSPAGTAALLGARRTMDRLWDGLELGTE